MKKDTVVVKSGRHPEDYLGVVNPPVYHVSTVLWPTLDVLEGIRGGVPEGVTVYGRRGTPTTFALEEAIAELEGAAGAISFPSGLAAIAGALLAFVKTGDHVLVTDNVYGPTRRFCDTVLGRMGIETTYFDPLIGADIAALMKPNTAVVFVETPGSLTFEIQDVPAIAAAAHGGGAKALSLLTIGRALDILPPRLAQHDTFFRVDIRILNQNVPEPIGPKHQDRRCSGFDHPLADRLLISNGIPATTR